MRGRGFSSPTNKRHGMADATESPNKRPGGRHPLVLGSRANRASGGEGFARAREPLLARTASGMDGSQQNSGWEEVSAADLGPPGTAALQACGTPRGAPGGRVVGRPPRPTALCRARVQDDWGREWDASAKGSAGQVRHSKSSQAGSSIAGAAGQPRVARAGPACPSSAEWSGRRGGWRTCVPY